MAEVVVRLCSQEGRDAEGRLQSHQWAEVPVELAGPYMSGGLKKIRRLAEGYFGFRFSESARRVRGRWRSGEPHLLLQYYHLPGLHGREIAHLGRLRSSGTRDVYRGYLEVRGGEMVSGAAILEQRPWPADIPWVAPSAGEFTDSEKQRSSYLGIFEFRIERTSSGCTIHTTLFDFPPAESGFLAKWGTKPWQPMRRAVNLAFLRREIGSTAHELGLTVRFEEQQVPGTPARPRFTTANPQPTGA
jgi:hypothetical protein